MSLERRPRVIIHVDLDAFYCQVEQKRHGIPREVPCAVQQWEGLIAVNYAARAAGVTRHMRVGEAKKICPQLRTVHVETIGEGGGLSPGRSQAGAGRGGGGGGGGASAARRSEAKASLQPYRQASGQIMRVLGGLLGPGCLLEKASVDEAFLDVTPMAEEELRRLEGGSAAGGAGAAADAAGLGFHGGSATVGLDAGPDNAEQELDEWGMMQGLGAREGNAGGGCGFGGDGGGDGGGADDDIDGYGDVCGARGFGSGLAGGGSCRLSSALLSEARRAVEASVVVGGPTDLLNETDRRLVVGALIALRLRQAVRAELDFTCSAGVATNKLLAKVGSARNKPDKQTLVLPRGVADLMQDMPLGKLRGLGGKLGASLEQHFGATTAGQVQRLALEQLQRALGERTGLWVSQIVRGQCAEPVTPKSQPKSLLSCKSFEPTRDLADLSRWLAILAEELAGRCREDEAAHRRRARTLVLHYRGTGPRERSVRCVMPPHGREGPSPAALAKAALEMLRRQPDALPCSRLAIAATEFDDPPAVGSRAITRFFAQPASRPQHQQQGLEQPLSSCGNDDGGCAGDGCSDDEYGDDGRGCDGGADACDGAGAPQPPQQPQRQQQQEQEQQQGRHHAAAASGERQPRPHAEAPPPLGPSSRPPKKPRLEITGVGGVAHQGQQLQQTLHPHNQTQTRTDTKLQQPQPASMVGPASLDCWLHDDGGGESAATVAAKAAEAVPDGGGGGGWLHWDAPASAPGGDADVDFQLGGGGRGPRDQGVREDLPPLDLRIFRAQIPPAAAAAFGPGVCASPAGVAPAAKGGAGSEAGRAGAGSVTTVASGRSDPDLVDADADAGPADPNLIPDPAADLFSDVDLDEQRRILHEIELARLRGLGRSKAPGEGHGGGVGGGGGRRGGGGGAGRGRGRASTSTAAPAKGQMRLTAMLQPRQQQQAKPPASRE